MTSLFKRHSVAATNGAPKKEKESALSAPNGTPKENGVKANGSSKSEKQSKPVKDTKDGKNEKESGSSIISDFREKIKKGLHFEPTALAAVVDAVRHADSIDDRKFLLEHALTFVSQLEPGAFATGVQNKIIEMLYNDLTHPPATTLGTKNAWRTADGSYNNIDVPEMGQAGKPYARSVQQTTPLPRDELPDAGLVFDALLRRKGFEEHPGGLSSLMFAFAALVIHTCFRTSHENVEINETSSYVDLAPLYGNDQAMQDQVRNKDGRGLLHPDAFAENRLLLLPPAVCALLVLFNRNHNYIAKKLLEINEKGTFNADLSKLTEEQKLKQDEEIFQVARLCNCGWFGAVVFSDYFSAILGLVRTGSNWSLNPFGEIRDSDHSLFERGRGNVCSVEFNCLYRWHATTSKEDEQWVEAIAAKMFPGKKPDEITPRDFYGVAKQAMSAQPDLEHWTFGGLKRNDQGQFDDDQLANVIMNATDHPAAAFRARGTPDCMKLHEVMGIEQNRRWGVCSLNDFRKYLGLKPYSSFLEWNTDKEVAQAAEKLYGHIDRLELYTGLQAEEAKPVMEGAGLCPGYTISRAILSDAIALTRGDRFFTHDFTPFNLTSWGFADCQRDPDAFGFGSTLGRLFLRALPNNFTENSVYTYFPLMTPGSMKTHLKEMNLTDQYDFVRPGVSKPPQRVNTYKDVSAILKNVDFQSSYGERVKKLTDPKGFYTASTNDKEVEAVQKAIAGSPGAEDSIAEYFHKQTKKLIEANSFSLVGDKTKIVDIVREVFRYAPVQWAATEIAGFELKKDDKDDDGLYTPAELYKILGDIYSYVFFDVEPSKIMVLQNKVKKDVHTLLGQIKAHIGGGFRLSTILGRSGTVKKATRSALVKNLKALTHSSDELAVTVLAIMIGSTVELSLAFSNVVNLLIDSESEHAKLLKSEGEVDHQKIVGLVKEALRYDPAIKGVFRKATKEVSVDGITYPAGSKVLVSLASAYKDESVFASPNELDFARTASEDYLLAHTNLSRCLGESLSTKIIAQTLLAVFSFPNIARAPGQSGTLKRYSDDSYPELEFAYLENGKNSSPWPNSMCLQFSA